MSLERFRRSRMVILPARTTAYQAARAMHDNHVGSVLVSEQGRVVGMVTDRDLALVVLGGRLDPDRTALREIMSGDVAQCEIGSSLDEAVRLMREHGVRRIPLTEGGKPVGLLTLDDLIVDGSLDAQALAGIVSAQLEVEAPQKPAGEHHPVARSNAASKTRALMRARARAESTYNVMLGELAGATGIARNAAEQALVIAACMLCRRLTTGEAEDLIAQLPSLLQAPLARCANGPDRTVTKEAIVEEVARVLGVDAFRADVVMRAIFAVIARRVSSSQIDEVRGQLPDAMKDLFPPQAAAEAG